MAASTRTRQQQPGPSSQDPPLPEEEVNRMIQDDADVEGDPDALLHRGGRRNHGGGGSGEWKKYARYEISTDPTQDDKATEIILCQFRRPHMRAFHCNWWAFFMAFFIWFSITPLLPAIQDSLGLTGSELWSSNVASVGSTVVVRIILGPLCDLYGPRILYVIVITATAIPAACTGLVQSAQHLIWLRIFIGVGGGTFVMCEYWATRMFCKEIVGTANALVAGWGNLGAGVTNLVIGSFLFPLFVNLFDDDPDKAWRTVCIIPSVLALVTGIVIYFISDDAPKGNYSELKAHGVFPAPNLTYMSSLCRGTWDINAWVLAIQYGCCFGVELTMNNAVQLYFRDEFGQSTVAAAAIASVFGWLNLFSRALGGFVSDLANHYWGMKGRIQVHTLCLVCEGTFIFIFVHTKTLAASIIALVCFSLFVKACDGTSFGIVPYIKPGLMGSVSGLVGAGGNMGAVVFGLCFRDMNYVKAFHTMGTCVLLSALLSLFIRIPGYSGLLGGRDLVVDKETGHILCSSKTSESNDDDEDHRVIVSANDTADEDD